MGALLEPILGLLQEQIIFFETFNFKRAEETGCQLGRKLFDGGANGMVGEQDQLA